VELLDLAKKVLSWGSDEELEVYLSRNHSTRIEVSDLEVESSNVSTSEGLGIRCIKEGRSGFAYTTVLSVQAAEVALAEARENARFADPDPARTLPQPQGEAKVELASDKAALALPMEEKIEFARRIERAARAKDSRVRKVRQAQYADTSYELAIANSKGLAVAHSGTFFTSSILAVAEDNGNAEMGWSYHFARELAKLDLEPVGEEAAQRALALLGAQRGQSARVPVVLDPMVAADFLGSFASAFSAESVQKGKSLFADLLGQQVAAPLVTLVDDGTYPEGISTAPVDDEGVPTQRTAIIEGGKLTSFLFDTYTAQKEGASSTGNALRSSFRSTPSPGPTNLFIQPGEKSPQQIIGEIKRGLYVTDVMGMHTANPISGDFSVGVSGHWIENGNFVKPVRSMAIAGNWRELLLGITAVGSDLRWVGGIGAPTICIGEMSLSGE
jgi:PmbA protein